MTRERAPHTVTSIREVFDSGNIAAGASWSFISCGPGTYDYVFLYNPWMRGSVVVSG